MREVISNSVPIVLAIGITLVVLAALLIFQELKPLTLRNPDGDMVPAARDADAATTLFALVLNPEDPALKALADSAREQKRVIDIPNRTRVDLVGRRFYKNGRLREQLSLHSVEGDYMKNPDLIVERVQLLSLDNKGMEVWVESKYCKKRKLPF